MIFSSGSKVTSFFFNDTATTEIYTLSLHDALPISPVPTFPPEPACTACTVSDAAPGRPVAGSAARSEEHTSELQSLTNLVCRLLLEKKKKTKIPLYSSTKKNKRIN